jgi:hypothetical protein
MVKKILNFLGEIQSEKSLVSDINISEKNFHEFQTIEPSGMFYAIDGGNATIIDCGNWLISKIKVCALGYGKKECIKRESSEHYAGVLTRGKKTFLKLDPENKELEQTNLPVGNIEDIPNECRAFLEWEKIKEISKNIKQCEIIITDGLPPNGHQISNTTIASICKSCRLSTSNGRSLIGYINELGSRLMTNKKWYYYPVFENEQNHTTVIAKLHEKSNFCYRIQINETRDSTKLKEILGIISYFSGDPELLGYPYPLLKADKVARLRDDEKDAEHYRAKISAKEMGINFIEFDESSTIMHNLLDKRAYR